MTFFGGSIGLSGDGWVEPKHGKHVSCPRCGNVAFCDGEKCSATANCRLLCPLSRKVDGGHLMHATLGRNNKCAWCAFEIDAND